MKRSFVIAAICAALLARSPAARGADVQRPPAPVFELGTLEGDRTVSSARLFSEHRHVFLVFWSAGCPHCVDALRSAQLFFASYGGPDIAVVGVNSDERDPFEVKGVLEMNGVTFTQLHDPGAVVSKAYGVPFETFTIVHVERRAVAAVQRDPAGDAGAVMERMLVGGAAAAGALSPEAAPVDAGAAEPRGTEADLPTAAVPEGPQFAVHVYERLRAMSVDSRGERAAGLYGESVKPGNSTLYRIEAEASARIAPALRIGGLLRISNENEKVLESGPSYYGSRWGSAFAEVAARGFRLRLGYYSIYMTPLTLMRWDWDDNPRVGGDTGCGCVVAAGAVLFESLEELGPELTFEGALATYGFSGFETRLFYAVPRRALETGYASYRSGAAPRARYSLELGGAEVRWRRLDPRTGSFWRLAARVLGSFEDRHSVDFAALGYAAADPWTSSGLASVSGEAPLLRALRLRGEIVAWNRTVEEGILTGDGVASAGRNASGGIGGIEFAPSSRHLLEADYLRLHRNYLAPFAALSYEPGMEGVRVSARESLVPERIGLSLFYKRLREIEPATAERTQLYLYGASLDVDAGSGWGAGIGWLGKRYWRGGATDDFETTRRAAAAHLSRGFGKHGVIQAQYQRIENRGSLPWIEGDDSSVDLYSIDATVRF